MESLVVQIEVALCAQFQFWIHSLITFTKSPVFLGQFSNQYCTFLSRSSSVSLSCCSKSTRAFEHVDPSVLILTGESFASLLISEAD